MRFGSRLLAKQERMRTFVRAPRAPRQQSLKLAAAPLTSGREVIYVALADVQALPPAVRERLRKHFAGNAGGNGVFLRDCDDVHQALGSLERERKSA